MSDDPFDLQRFVDAQEAAGTYAQALGELVAGRKRGHWIWFVLPQLAGLGRSATAAHYGISGLPEARAYLAHPLLGPRLLECARALTAAPGPDPVAVLGDVDALKVASSMTLFAAAADGDAEAFTAVLDHYFDGRRDAATTAMLATAGQR